MADRIRRIIEADPRPYLNALQRSSQATQRFSNTQNAEFRRVASSFRSALGALGIGVSVGAIVSASDRFALGLRKIRVGLGTTGQEAQRVERIFDNVFARVPQDAEEVGSAISSLNRILGAEGDLLERLSLQVLNASRLMGEDGANNATLFARALNQFNEPAERGTDILDTLFNVSQRTGVGFTELLGATNEYGSVLKNANFTIEESAELFGRLSSAGISVSRVSPGLNAAFRNWAKEGKNVREELARVVKQMQNAESETAALAIAADAFGAEGAQRLTTAVRTGRLELDQLSKAADGARGAIRKANEATVTFGEEFIQLARTIGKETDTLFGFSLTEALARGLRQLRRELQDDTLLQVQKRLAELTGERAKLEQNLEFLQGRLEIAGNRRAEVEKNIATVQEKLNENTKERIRLIEEEARLQGKLPTGDGRGTGGTGGAAGGGTGGAGGSPEQQEILKDLDEQLKTADRMKRIFGDSFDEISAKAAALRKALEKLAATEISPDSRTITELRDRFRELVPLGPDATTQRILLEQARATGRTRQGREIQEATSLEFSADALARVGLERQRIEQVPGAAFDEQFESLLEDIDKGIEESDKLEKIWTDIGGRIGDAGVALVGGLVRGTHNWQDALQLVLREVSSIIQALVRADSLQSGGTGQGGTSGASIAGQVVSSVGSFIGSLFHEGGMVGPGGRRLALPSYHGGGLVQPGEALVKVMEGETIRTPAQEAALRTPLDRIGDVMRNIQAPNPNLSGRIEGGGRQGPPNVQVNLNAPLLDPAAFKSSPDEILTVIVDGYEYHAGLRDATGREISRRSGR